MTERIETIPMTVEEATMLLGRYDELDQQYQALEDARKELRVVIVNRWPLGMEKKTIAGFKITKTRNVPSTFIAEVTADGLLTEAIRAGAVSTKPKAGSVKDVEPFLKAHPNLTQVTKSSSLRRA